MGQWIFGFKFTKEKRFEENELFSSSETFRLQVAAAGKFHMFL